MSLKDIVDSTLSDLRKKTGKKDAEFSFGTQEPTLGEGEGAGDVPFWIPSGLTLLDARMGGGWPAGRYSEVFSQVEAAGKSTLGVNSMIGCQRIGGIPILIEQENAFDKARAAAMGLNLDNFVRWSPPAVEDGFEYLETLMEKMKEDEAFAHVPKLVVWDTVAASCVRAEVAGDNKFKDGMMKRPRVVSEAHRKYKDLLQKYNIHFMWINQSYTVIGKKTHIPMYETPGGKAIKFYASIRLKLKKVSSLGAGKAKKKEEDEIGILVEMRTEKNKMALPGARALAALYGPTGYHDAMSLAFHFLDTKDTDMISGEVRYQLPGLDKTVYWKDIPETVAENPQIYDIWRARVWEKYPLPAGRQVDPVDGVVKTLDWVGQSLTVPPPSKKNRKKAAK